MTAPTFGANERPADVLDGAGRWLASGLPGFRWVKSRHDIERKSPPQVHRVGFQSSTWSRAGIATWVSARLMIFDDRLLRWRTENEGLSTVRDPHSTYPTAFNSLFVNFLPGCSDFEASGLPQHPDGPTTIGLEQFLLCLKGHVLPVLDDFADPALLVAELPPAWWGVVDAATVEWSIACSDYDSAAVMIHRHMERPLVGEQTAASRLSQFRQGWDAANRGGRAANGPFSTAALGWLSGVHALVDPTAIGPPATHQ